MFRWKYPLLLLGGIGVSNIGGWVYLIALNLIVIKETGSALAVSMLYILGPLAAICTNAWAGSFIDRMNSRKLMIALDVFRAICIALIPFMPSLVYVYVLAFIINLGSAIFEPTAMVYMTKLIPEKDRQRFNALRGFIDSAGTLLGPMIAGLLFWMGTPYTAIHVNAVALLLSSLVILLLPNVDSLKSNEIEERITWRMIKDDFRVVLRFSRKSTYVVKVYLLFCGTVVFMTAIDSIEAVFAKDILFMSDTNYGFLLSIFGGGIILGTIINSVFSKQLALNFLMGFGTVFCAIGYLIYYSSINYYSAAIGMFIMGFACIFTNTGFLTFYQNQVPVKMMGRFSSIFDIIESALIIVFIILVGGAAELTAIRPVGLISSGGFLLLGIVLYVVVMKRERRSYFSSESSV